MKSRIDGYLPKPAADRDSKSCCGRGDELPDTGARTQLPKRHELPDTAAQILLPKRHELSDSAAQILLPKRQ